MVQQRGIWLIVAAAVGCSAPVAAQGGGGSPGLAALLDRIGARVEAYFARAQSIVCDERMFIRSLGYSSAGDAPVRTLAYELRVAWEAADDDTVSDATVLRELRAINGRRPREGEDPGCMDPRSVSPEPLAMLLPGRQDEYLFIVDGAARVSGRETAVLIFQLRDPGANEITWSERCVSVDLPARTSGRLWADVETGDVLRVDEHVRGLFEFDVPDEHRGFGGQRLMALERADSSIRYRPVTFEDPDEVLMLPASIEAMSVWRGAGSQRVITTQELSGCRRFITDARIVP
jgi:hypothetical protein